MLRRPGCFKFTFIAFFFSDIVQPGIVQFFSVVQANIPEIIGGKVFHAVAVEAFCFVAHKQLSSAFFLRGKVFQVVTPVVEFAVHCFQRSFVCGKGGGQVFCIGVFV